MNKFSYRQIYNVLGSRRLRVTVIEGLRRLGKRVYRIAMDVNNLCNLRCVMCYMSLDEYRVKANKMSLNRFEALAKDAFPRARVLDMSCSYEPFMTKGFVNYLRIARAHCRGHISICTNATLMTTDDIEAMIRDALIDELVISMDGLTEMTNTQVRVNADYQRIIRNLEAVRDRRRDGKPIVRMNYTMLRQNVEEVEGLYPFVCQYGIDVVQLRHAVLTREFSHLYKDSLYRHQAISDRVLRSVEEDFKRDRKRQLIVPQLFGQGGRTVCPKANCAYAWFHFRITSDGTIWLCGMRPIGNIADGFGQVVNSVEVKAIRRQLLGGDYKELCKNCYVITEVANVQEATTFMPQLYSEEQRRRIDVDWRKATTGVGSPNRGRVKAVS